MWVGREYPQFISVCIHNPYIVDNYQLTPHGTVHILLLSAQKRERRNSDENIIFRSPLLGDMGKVNAISAEMRRLRTKQNSRIMTKWYIFISCSKHCYWWNAIANTNLNWSLLPPPSSPYVYVCIALCDDRYELVNIWMAISLYSKALKPIIEPLINLNLLRLCSVQILICVERAFTPCVCHSSGMCVCVCSLNSLQLIFMCCRPYCACYTLRTWWQFEPFWITANVYSRNNFITHSI